MITCLRLEQPNIVQQIREDYLHTLIAPMDGGCSSISRKRPGQFHAHSIKATLLFCRLGTHLLMYQRQSCFQESYRKSWFY